MLGLRQISLVCVVGMSLLLSGCGITQKVGSLSDRFNPFDEDGAAQRAEAKAARQAKKAEAKAAKAAARADKAAAKAMAAEKKAAAKAMAAKDKADAKAMAAEERAATAAETAATKADTMASEAAAQLDTVTAPVEAATPEMPAEAPVESTDTQPPLPPVGDIVFDDETPADAPPPAPAEVQTFEVVVPEDDYVFLPRLVTIYEGDSILWRNNSGVVHLFASIPGSDPSGAMEIEPSDLDVGARVNHTFEKAGTYPYFCFIHNRMTGKIEVLPR